MATGLCAAADPDADNFYNQLAWILGVDPKTTYQLGTWLSVDAATVVGEGMIR